MQTGLLKRLVLMSPYLKLLINRVSLPSSSILGRASIFVMCAWRSCYGSRSSGEVFTLMRLLYPTSVLCVRALSPADRSRVMQKAVVIDCFPENLGAYRDGYAIVAVDVIRATTTAVTGVALGRRCFPAPTLEAAVPLAARLSNPLLVGELGGSMPYGFDLSNSPADVAVRSDTERPMILLSTSGTRLICDAYQSDAAYVACLRNSDALITHLAGRHGKVA